MDEEYRIRWHPIARMKNSPVFAVGANCIAHGDYDGFLNFYDFSGNLISTIRPEDKHILMVAFNARGDLVLVCPFSCNLYIANTNGRYVACFQHSQHVVRCAFDPEFQPSKGLSCVFSDYNGTVYRINPPRISFKKRSQDELESLIVTDSSIVKIAPKITGIDTIEWAKDIIFIAETEQVTLFSASSNQKIIQIKPAIADTLGKTTAHTKIIIGSNNIVTMLINSVIIEYNTATQTKTVIGKKSNALTIARNSQGLAKFYPGANPDEFYLSIPQNGQEVITKLPVELTPYDSKQSCSLITRGDDFVLMLPTSVSIISFVKDSERTDYFLENEFEVGYQMFIEKASQMNDEEKNRLLIKISEHLLKTGEEERAVKLIGEYGALPFWMKFIDFFIRNDRLFVAIDVFMLKADEMGKQQLVDLLVNIIGKLLSIGEVDKAKEMVMQFNNPQFLPYFINIFAGFKKIDEIIDDVPLDQLELSPEELTKLYVNLARKSPERGSAALATVDFDRVDCDQLLGELRMLASTDPHFTRPLVRFLHHKGKHEDAFSYTIRMKDESIFDAIKESQLYSYAVQNFSLLFRTYRDKFTHFLLENDQSNPEEILAKTNEEMESLNKAKMLPNDRDAALEEMERFQLSYLEKVAPHSDDLINKYVTTMAVLYLKYGKDDIISFLKKYNTYDVGVVRAAADKYKAYEVVVAIVYWSGAFADGLTILLEKIKDPHKSIQYAVKVDNKGIWDTLIAYSLDHPDYLRCMLEALPSLHIDPVAFVSKIKNVDMVPEFGALAEQAIKEFKRKEKTAKLTQQIIESDAFGAFSRSFDRARRGRSVTFY